MPTDIQLSNDEVRKAFSQLLEPGNLYQEHCFCFFIDGLDEYEAPKGRHQEDQKDMVKLLCKWVANAPDGIKICVSSREENVFLNAFSSERRLRLQDLTRRDMELFTQERLEHSNDENLGDIVRDLVYKGNGIFLWVALVVESFRERLEDGHKLCDLTRKLDSLPAELEDLFDYLLNSLDKTALQKAYQIFNMVMTLKDDKHVLTLLSYSFLREYEEDSTFATQEKFLFAGMDVETTETRIVQTRKQVRGYCKGLVESSYRGLSNRQYIDFTHRSVPEYLKRQARQKEMESNLRDFDTEKTIAHLMLAEFRLTEPNSISRNDTHYPPVESRAYIIYKLCSLACDIEANQAPFRFLECVSSAVRQQEQILSEDDVQWLQRLPKTIIGHWGHGIHICNTHQETRETVRITSPLYIAAFLGNHEYVRWKMTQDTSFLDCDYNTALLLCCYEHALFHGKDETFAFIHTLLQQQILSPSAMIHTSNTVVYIDIKGELSFWEHFILVALHSPIFLRNSNWKRGFGEAIEHFLELGADPRLSISISTFGIPHTLIIELKRGSRKAYVQGSSIPQLFFIMQNGGNASLREVITFWELDNEKRILELIDVRTKE